MSELIDSSDIKFPSVAKAISAHETGNYKSNLFKDHNNAFGFKGKRGYKKYPSLQDSIEDYIILETKVILKYSPRSSREFLMFLARRYAKDPHWKNKIKKYL